MLEYACYNGNYYGTPKAAVERERQQGNDVILEIEVQGALQVKAARMHCSSLWHRRALNSLPNGCAEGRPRTSRRSTTVLPLRGELAQAQQYDYIVVNDTVEQAVEDLDSHRQGKPLSNQ